MTVSSEHTCSSGELGDLVSHLVARVPQMVDVLLQLEQGFLGLENGYMVNKRLDECFKRALKADNQKIHFRGESKK